MTVPTRDAAPPAVPSGRQFRTAGEKASNCSKNVLFDVVFCPGQGGDCLDNHTSTFPSSTFRTTPMANLLLVDDEPKLIFKQVSHVFAPRGSQIELVRSGGEAIRHVAKGKTDVV